MSITKKEEVKHSNIPKDFDVDWYKKKYLDVKKTQLSPEEHYLKYGVFLGRSKNEFESKEKIHKTVIEKKNNSLAVKEAYNTSLKVSYDAAYRYLSLHASEVQLRSQYVLKANESLPNTTSWLKNTNLYLKSIGLTPIYLNEKKGYRFKNITSKSVGENIDGPLVSVIMPAFNAEKTISNAIESILNQTWKNVELIIVDDNSSDKTADKIAKYMAKDKRVKFIKCKKNLGPYVAKNYALRLANGDYITGQDADDWSHPQRLEKHIKYMLKNTSIKASVAKKVRLNNELYYTHFIKAESREDDGVLSSSFISCMFETKFFRKYLGAWDCVRFGADGELISRAKKILGEGFKEINLFTMFCLDSDTSLTNHPVHGISKSTGLSESRKFYLKNFKEWHTKAEAKELKLEFPQRKRPFDINKASKVDEYTLNDFMCFQ